MIKYFGDLVDRFVEAYVDDIVVKTRRSEGLVTNIRLTFERLKANDIKLNPKNVSSTSRGACYLASWFSRKGSRPTLRKLRPTQTWGPYGILKEFNESKDD
jgi:hypothetical protein